VPTSKRPRSKGKSQKSKAGAPLDRATVVRAAIALLDEVGLDGLTVRRLAEALGVQNPALYWHFANKQVLLDEIAATLVHDAFAAAEPPGPREPWQSWVRLLGRTFRRAMLSHRDGARVIASADLVRTDLIGGLEHTVQRLSEFGFAPLDALIGVLAVADYTLGSSFEEQSDPGTSDPTRLSARDRQRVFAKYPSLLALMDQLAGARPKPGASYEAGLELLVDGMATRLGAGKRSRVRSP